MHETKISRETDNFFDIDSVRTIRNSLKVKTRERPPGAQNRKRTGSQAEFDTSTRRKLSRFEYVEAEASFGIRGVSKLRLRQGDLEGDLEEDLEEDLQDELNEDEGKDKVVRLVSLQISTLDSIYESRFGACKIIKILMAILPT